MCDIMYLRNIPGVFGFFLMNTYAVMSDVVSLALQFFLHLGV